MSHVAGCYLQQFEGGQQLPGAAVPSVHLVVLQLRGEPRRAVVLVAHLDGGLGEGPAYELGLALSEARRRGGGGGRNKGWGELDAGVGGAVCKAAT